MSRYLVLLSATEDEDAADQRFAQMPMWLELTESLRAAGLLVANGALHRTEAATTARVYRDERVAVLATLIRQVGDFQLAEDSVQDAFESALSAADPDAVDWAQIADLLNRAADRPPRRRLSSGL